MMIKRSWHNNATQKAINTTNSFSGRYRGNIGVCTKGNKNEKYLASSNASRHYFPDGTVVRSTHICDYEIPGLPTRLEAHIVSDLTVALLIGIRVLCKAGCVIISTDKMCSVMYDGKVILQGYKDPSTDLWILPVTPNQVH